MKRIVALIICSVFLLGALLSCQTSKQTDSKTGKNSTTTVSTAGPGETGGNGNNTTEYVKPAKKWEDLPTLITEQTTHPKSLIF